MRLTRRTLLSAAGALAAAPVLPVRAQPWPSRPVRIIVGTAAGGSPDIVAKLADDGTIPTPSTPEAYRAHVEREIKTWSRVIAAANIKAG